MSHTPGPWKAPKRVTPDLEDMYSVVWHRDADNMPCILFEVRPGPSQKGNAFLAAAAPALLEAAEAAVPWIEALSQPLNRAAADLHAINELGAVLRNLRAAIRQARGEQ